MINKESAIFILKEHFVTSTFDVKVTDYKMQIMINNKPFSFWLDDWVHKNSIVLSILSSVLGLNKRIFARSCQIEKVNKQTAETFLNENHLLGYKTAYYKYALFYQKDVIAIATFSKGRRMNRLEANKRSFELISFCSKKGISVTGGLSKLISHFISELQPGDIMTYVDKDWSNGNSYLKLGFAIHSETAPQSFIFDKKNFIKYFLEKAPENVLQELENHKENFEIFKNTGNLKLVYTI